MLERVFANGWTRESLRRKILERSLEIGRLAGDVARALNVMDQMDDAQLSAIVQQLADEIDAARREWE